MLGYIAGFLTCAFIVAFELYLRPKDRPVQIIENMMHKKGDVVFAKTDEEEETERKIEENNKQGQDTNINDLF